MEISLLMFILSNAFKKLKGYCEAENFAGWDPYDGLNSKVFQATPLRHWDLARLVFIQAFKRCPLNLRTIFLVPKQHNAKGIGLFLNGYCNLYTLAEKGDLRFGTELEIKGQIIKLADLLLEMQNQNYSGACWGYNFDWQARRLFLFPAHTPTVVATTFCVQALFQAYEITRDQRYLDTALSSANFVLDDLSRTECRGGFILSYSPLPGNNTVYNASLLGAKLLSLCYAYSGNELYKDTAEKIVRAACDGQNEDGSWVYGLLPVQSWIDSFHTGYNLDAIACYQRLCGDNSFDKNVEKGLEFYLQNFFLEGGVPKYYHDAVYPIDIHCPGQLWITLSSLNKWQENAACSEQVLKWSIIHMQDSKGYFYYQLKKGISSKIPYMRWSNAFMFNALSYYLVEDYE